MKKVHLATYLFYFFASFLIVSGFSSCGADKSNTSPSKELMIQGSAQGTSYTVKYIGEMIEALPQQLDSLLDAVDHSLSTYDSTSLISSFNRGDTIKADHLFKEMYAYSLAIHKETNGAFDPTLGPLIKAWGWGFSKAEDMDSLKVDSLLKLKGFDKIFLDEEQAYLILPHARLNYNAIAQGYSVDLMAGHLEKLGIKDYYVELGGEVKAKGLNQSGQAWRVGIDRPEENNLERELVAIVSLEDRAMATSGNYRKFYEKDGKRYAHTLDPKSGYPVEHNLLSATVISKECYRADALATAFMVMGLEKAKTFLEESKVDQALLIYSKDDGSYGFYMTSSLEEKIEKVALKD